MIVKRKFKTYRGQRHIFSLKKLPHIWQQENGKILEKRVDSIYRKVWIKNKVNATKEQHKQMKKNNLIDKDNTIV